MFIALFATKLGQTWRLSYGASLEERLLNFGSGFAEAMQSPLPSFHPLDLLVGVIIALLVCQYREHKMLTKY